MDRRGSAQLKTVTGTVDSVTYRNDDNGFAVIVLDHGGEPLTVVGELGNVEEGEELELTGSFSSHPRFGMQFKAEACVHSLPQTASAIQRFLAGGIIKGIGPVTAAAMVKRFREKTLDILENEPERLGEIQGISLAKALSYSSEFKKVIGFRAVLDYFSGCGLSASYGVRVWRKYGASSLELINSNPYILCDASIGLPFNSAEELAGRIGEFSDSRIRIIAGVRYILLENSYAGHSCLPLNKLLDTASKLLSLDRDIILEAIEDETEDNGLYIAKSNSKSYIMLKELYVAEDYIARRLSIMNTLAYDTRINYDDVIDLAEREHGINYAKEQRLAINTALSKGFMILTGGPGTGKTTALEAIISLLEQQGLRVMICAPTGRAAKRISDLTGYEAKTIHRLLGVRPGQNGSMSFEHNELNPLECDAVVIDEMSMVDSLLFEALLRALGINCKLIMVGDSDQLPSVGAGNVLHDLIKSGRLPVISLTEIFRQASQSAIVTNAHRIVKGVMPELSRSFNDFFFLQRLDFESAMSLTVELCTERLPNAYGFSPIDDIQVLTPTRKGPLGTVELNKRLQAELNPPSKDKSEIKTLLYTFRTGDKVMQIKNDYDLEWKKDGEKGSGIFNGDIGVIRMLNRILGIMEIDFDGRLCSYSLSSLENLELAYAATVHKSQGSEFEAVIMPILGGYDKLYFRNLLYTAVTRAKRLIVLVGSSKRIEYMVNNNRRMNRYTLLETLIREYYGNNAPDGASEEDEGVLS